MNCDPSEHTDNNITVNKVNKLFRDGLKLRNVKVTSCERKSSKGQKPGVIVASIENTAQKKTRNNVGESQSEKYNRL